MARIVTLGRVPEQLRRPQSDGEAARSFADHHDESFQDAKRKLIGAFEKDYLAAKLRQCENNISRAARESGMERSQFKRLLRKYDLISGGSEDER